jgi:prevent-host-death family protein
MTWQLQEAKQRFSEVVRRALEQGPQVVTRHGEAAVVIVAAEEYEALKGGNADFKEFLRKAPDLGRLKITRDRRAARKVEL